MEHKYVAQQYLAIRREKIVPIPDDCAIDKSRLSGLTNDEFVSAFRTAQETFAAMYDDAVTDPDAWGYPLEEDVRIDDQNCGPMGVRYDRISDAFYFLFNEGQVRDKVLYVNIKNYKDKIKKHKKNALILDGLKSAGFEISGFEKSATEYAVSFPDDENVIVALASYVKAVDEVLLPLKKEYQLGPRMDYMGCLLYRFVEDRAEQKYDFIFHVLTDQVPQNYRDMCVELYEKAASEGHPYHSYYNWCYHSIEFGGFLGLSLAYQTKEIWTRIKVHKLIGDEHIEKLYALPDKLRACFERTTCTYCNGSKPADGTCVMRSTYNWHGKKIEGCAYQSFKFKQLDKEDLPYLIDLYKAEYEK
jgi:hypothetical protein